VNATLLDRTALLVKLPVFAAAALPGLSLAWRLLDGSLAANPYQPVIRETGLWSLRLLVVGFAITPLATLGGLTPLLSVRRMIGLFAAFYAAVHLAAWAKDFAFAWSFLVDEIVQRLYLAIGAVAALAMLILTATSGETMARRIGVERWRRLHGLVYVALVGALAHYVLARRAGFAELIGYGAALALLGGWRVARRVRSRP
jgi:sulfoxide reductase heme-binding subunit YedZ